MYLDLSSGAFVHVVCQRSGKFYDSCLKESAALAYEKFNLSIFEDITIHPISEYTFTGDSYWRHIVDQAKCVGKCEGFKNQPHHHMSVEEIRVVYIRNARCYREMPYDGADMIVEEVIITSDYYSEIKVRVYYK